jgi:hypothetical protein
MSDRTVLVLLSFNEALKKHCACRILVSKTSDTRNKNAMRGCIIRLLYASHGAHSSEDQIGLVFIRHTLAGTVHLKRGECLVEFDETRELAHMSCVLERSVERFFLHNRDILHDALGDMAMKAWRDFKDAPNPTPDDVYGTIALWNLQWGVRNADWDGVD